MTLTLWKITKEVAVFEDDRMIGWDHDSHWFATTKGDDDREDLLTCVAEMNDCDVRADAVIIMEVPEYEVEEIVKVISLILPPRRCRLCGEILVTPITGDLCGQCLQGELETEPELRIPGAV